MFHDPYARIVDFSLHHGDFAKHYVSIAYEPWTLTMKCEIIIQQQKIDVGIGLFLINLIITYNKEQHKYEVERFNPNVHILVQRLFL